MFKRFLPLALAALLLSHPAAASETRELYAASPVTVDQAYPRITSFGQEGGIQIENKWPSVITLARVPLKYLKVDQSYMNYSAELQGVNITGKAYLEMWLHFPSKGFAFSRGLEHPLTKDGGWASYNTPFILKAGEQPDEVVLNLHFEGVGNVRVRNVKLTDLQGASDKMEGKAEAAPARVPAKENSEDKPEEKTEEKAEKPADKE